MKRPQFSLRFLLLGTTYTAIAIAVSQSWTTAGALVMPFVVYVGFLVLIGLCITRKYSFSRFALPHVLALLIVSSTLILSLGPVCFLMTRLGINDGTNPTVTRAFRYVYHPISMTYCFSPEPIRKLSIQYLAWWFPEKSPLKDAGFRIQWITPTGWQVVQDTTGTIFSYATSTRFNESTPRLEFSMADNHEMHGRSRIHLG